MAVSQQAYGDSFIVNTPSLDRLSQYLFMEERQRRAIRDKEAQDLDNEFRKNIANIRDADVPEYTQKYADWKRANQSLMRGTPSNNKEYIQRQMEVQRKLADVYSLGNASKAARTEEEDLAKDAAKNPDNYDDNVFGLLLNRRKTPLTGLSQYKDANGNLIDLGNLDTYRYKGTDTDFAAIQKGAEGLLKPISYREEPVGNDNLQTKVIPLQFANTPAEYMQSLMGSFTKRHAGRDAAALWDKLAPETIADIDKKFEAIPIEKWKSIGLNAPQDLSIPPNASKAEKLASHLAKVYWLNNQVREGIPQFRVNEAEKLKRQYAQQKQMEAIRHANAKDLIDYRKSIDTNDTELNNLWVDRYIEQITNDARSKPENLRIYKFAGGNKQVEGYKIEIDPVLEKALGFDSKNPGQLLVTKDGKFIRSFYKTDANYNPETDKKTGSYLSDAAKTGELTQDQIKLALGKKSVTPTQLNKEMLGNQGGKKSTYSIKGKTYTEDQLLKMGYTIDQIAPYKK